MFAIGKQASTSPPPKLTEEETQKRYVFLVTSEEAYAKASAHTKYEKWYALPGALWSLDS
jgi:hypothetical protein